MLKLLRELWLYHWRFFTGWREYKVDCWKCQKPVVIHARRPRIDDCGPVASVKCKCGESMEVSYNCHAIVGFGRPMIS